MGVASWAFTIGFCLPLVVFPIVLVIILRIGKKINLKWVNKQTGLPFPDPKTQPDYVLLPVLEKEKGKEKQKEEEEEEEEEDEMEVLLRGCSGKGELDVKLAGSFFRYYCVVKNHRLYCFDLTSRTSCLSGVILDRSVTMKTRKKEIIQLTLPEKSKSSLAATMDPWARPLQPVANNKVLIKPLNSSLLSYWQNALVSEIEDLEPHRPPSPRSSKSNKLNRSREVELAKSLNDDFFEVEEEDDDEDEDDYEAGEGMAGWLYLGENRHWHKYYFRISFDYGVLTYFKSSNEDRRSEKDIIGIINLQGCQVTHGCECEYLKQHKKEHPFFIDHPEKRRIFLSTLPGSKRKVASSVYHANNTRAFLAAQSNDQMYRWQQALMKAIRVAVNAQVQVPTVPEGIEGQKVRFLNMFLDRLFRDMKDSKLFYNDIYTTLVSGFAGLKKPDFVAPITVDSVELGSRFIEAGNVKLINTSKTNEMVGEVELEYTGGLGIDLTTGISVNFAAKQFIPVKVKIRLLQVAGKAQLYAPSESQARWWFFFSDEPQISISINITVGQGGVRGSLTALPHLRKFIEGAARNAIISAFVWPSKITLNIPIPGKKLEPKIEVASSTSTSSSGCSTCAHCSCNCTMTESPSCACTCTSSCSFCSSSSCSTSSSSSNSPTSQKISPPPSPTSPPRSASPTSLASSLSTSSSTSSHSQPLQYSSFTDSSNSPTTNPLPSSPPSPSPPLPSFLHSSADTESSKNLTEMSTISSSLPSLSSGSRHSPPRSRSRSPNPGMKLGEGGGKGKEGEKGGEKKGEGDGEKCGEKPPAPVKTSTDAMANSFLVRRFFEEVFLESYPNFARHLPVIFSSECQVIGTNPFYDKPIRGYEGVKLFTSDFRRGLPDLKFEILDSQCEGSNVVVQFRITGTQIGFLWGRPPTNKRISMLGCVVSRVKYAKILSQMWFWTPETVVLFA